MAKFIQMYDHNLNKNTFSEKMFLSFATRASEKPDAHDFKGQRKADSYVEPKSLFHFLFSNTHTIYSIM